MALTPEEKWILIGVLAVLGMFVIYFEIRFMKGRSKEVRRASQRRDEAFNAVLTTRSVANALARQGTDTSKAQYLIDSAKQAMNSGNYERCMTLCERARGELQKIPPEPTADSDEEGELEAVAESILTADKRDSTPSSDTYTGTKLPVDQDGSYLSAKFELNTAKADISKAREQGMDVSEAESCLIGAETAFEAGSYSRALSMAVKARKSVSGEVTKETIPLKVARKPEPAKVGGGLPAPVKKDEVRCYDCSALIESDDEFCGICGAKVARERSCAICGGKAKSSDKFCRKCGAEI